MTLWKTIARLHVRHQPGTLGYSNDLCQAARVLQALAPYIQDEHLPGAEVEMRRALRGTAFESAAPKKVAPC